MSDERLEDLLARLEDERRQADALYHAALTALDKSIQDVPAPAPPPPSYDARQLTAVNQSWDTLPDGAPLIDGSVKGRLRGFIWRLVGPPLEKQKAFNAALVDHLNRNVAAHTQTQTAVAALIAATHKHVEGVVHFQSLLIQYLQTITLYVDTKDRSTSGQVQVVNAGVSTLTDDWMKRWESLSTREQRFNARVQALDDLRSVISVVQQTTRTLQQQLAQMAGQSPMPARPDSETRTGAAPDVSSAFDASAYLGFEDRFRGDRQEIRARLEQYLPIFDGARDVVDVGCGRGELLDLFRQHGVAARGLDINAAMVQECRARGLDASHEDAIEFLTERPDESLGGLIAIQVVEHLEPRYLLAFLNLAGRKLRPGAPMVLETINAACWLAYFESYVRDLTHVRPLHPDTLQYFVQASGFSRTEVRYSAPVPPEQKLDALRLTDETVKRESLELMVDAFNTNVARLNARLFTSMDFAVVAWK